MEKIKQMTIELLNNGLSQKELAELIGVSQPCISRIVNGSVSDIKHRVAISIENLYLKLSAK